MLTYIHHMIVIMESNNTHNNDHLIEIEPKPYIHITQISGFQ